MSTLSFTSAGAVLLPVMLLLPVLLITATMTISVVVSLLPAQKLREHVRHVLPLLTDAVLALRVASTSAAHPRASRSP